MAEMDHVIKLAKEGGIQIDNRTDFFDYNYILDCEKHNDIVPNLKDYRLGKSNFKDYEPLDVMHGNVKWQDIPKQEVGEDVSDIEDGDADDEAQVSNKPAFRVGKLPYSKKEDLELIKWITDNSAYTQVKGNEMWKAMAKDNVGKGRTYQSLKERFKKKIIKTIGSYDLQKDIVENLKFGNGDLEDDLVGARVSLLEENYKHKKYDHKERQKTGEDTETSPEEDVEDEDKKDQASDEETEESPEEEKKNEGNDIDDWETTEDDQIEFCSVCQKGQGSTPHKKICRDCSRPSLSSLPVISPRKESTRSPTKSPKKRAAAKDTLETLLENSGIDFSEKESDTTEPEPEQNDIPLESGPSGLRGGGSTSHEDDVLDSEPGPSGVASQAKTAKLPVPKKHTRQLFRPRMMETPATSNKKTKKGKAYEIESIPPSTLEFGIGLKEASKAKTKSKSTSQGDTDSVTEEEELDREGLTSTQFIGEEIETYRSPVIRGKRTKAMVTEKPKDTAKIVSKTKRTLAEDVDQEEDDGHDHSKSIDLIQRHIDDQLQRKKQKVQTQDLVSALNNVETDEENNMAEDDDDEVSFIAPRSPGRLRGLSPRRDNRNNEQWETSTIKSGRFFNEGSFMVNFRVPYSKREEKAIVKFFLTQGGYGGRKGVAIWKRMQAQEICPNRTWQSMKARWEKFIIKDLAKYDVTVRQLETAHRRIYGQDEDDDDSGAETEKENRREARKNAKMYSRQEDKKIIKYILENRRWEDVKGRAMWELLEQREIVPGRTWQSLKERFLKIIKRNVKDNPHIYNLDNASARKLLSFV